MNISILFQQTHFLSIAAQNSVICFYSFNGTPSQLNESWHHICKVYRRIYNCCTFNIAWCIDKKRNVYTEFSWKVFASLYLLLYSGFRETILKFRKELPGLTYIIVTMLRSKKNERKR